MNYTNNTIRDGQQTQEYALGLTTNYAVVTDEPQEVLLDNRTAPLDQQELISFRFRKIGSVNSELNIQNPSPVKAGVQYAVQIEETVREQLGDNTYVDHPVVMYLTVRHHLSGAITASVLQETFERLLSALRRESDNSYRFEDLVRGALRPISN
jgi:hypothetical protein